MENNIKTFKLNGKKLGTFNQATLEFRKSVKHSIHFFRKAGAWAIACEIVDILEKEGCTTMRLHDTENNKVYTSTFDNFKAKSWGMQFSGYEKQQFMALNNWTIEGGEKANKPLALDKNDKKTDNEKR